MARPKSGQNPLKDQLEVTPPGPMRTLLQFATDEGLTPTDLAVAMDVTLQTVNKYPLTKHPRPETLDKIAGALASQIRTEAAPDLGQLNALYDKVAKVIEGYRGDILITDRAALMNILVRALGGNPDDVYFLDDGLRIMRGAMPVVDFVPVKTAGDPKSEA